MGHQHRWRRQGVTRSAICGARHNRDADRCSFIEMKRMLRLARCLAGQKTVQALGPAGPYQPPSSGHLVTVFCSSLRSRFDRSDGLT